MTTITKSKNVENGYYINGVGILKSNIPFHKRTNTFTTDQIKALEDYIKAEDNS